MDLKDETDSACLSVLSTREIVGISFIAESGVISAVAVLIFAVLILRNIVYSRRHPGSHGETLPLIRTHVDGYMLSLMLADLLQGISAAMSAKWAANGVVTCSAYCSAQGIMQQLGETGVAMNTTVITLHTFATVFFRWQPSRHPRLWIIVITLIWAYIGLFVILGYTLHTGARKVGGAPYFGPTPFWCWIGPNYLWERVFGEYFWLWAAALVNIVLYPFLFFTLRGNVEVDPSNWKRVRFHRRGHGIFGQLTPKNRMSQSQRKDTESMRILRHRNKEAMKMFWYPISYTVLVLPLSITRWLTFHSRDRNNKPVRDMSIVTTSTVLFIFGLSGLVNVLLFLFTRPNLLLFNLRRDRRRVKKQETSSGVTITRQPSIHSARQTGLHRRRTRDEDWDIDDIVEDYDHENGYDDTYEIAAYPPPPSDVAPLPPPATSSIRFEEEEKQYEQSSSGERYRVRNASKQSLSGASTASPYNKSLAGGSDGQLGRSTPSLGRTVGPKMRSLAPPPTTSAMGYGTSRGPYSNASQELHSALGHSPAQSYAMEVTSSTGYRSTDSHRHSIARVQIREEPVEVSPSANSHVIENDEPPSSHARPQPPSQLPLTPLKSVYSPSSRLPPTPVQGSRGDNSTIPLSPSGVGHSAR